MDDSPDTVRDYLKRPYARVLTPDEEYGGYTAEILEFAGCVTEGDTATEALENLETAAEAWIEAALNMGQEIPEPSDSQEYGGRIALRLPRSLHGRAIRMAEREGTSLNQFLVAAIAEQVGVGTLYARTVQRLEQRAMEVAAYSLHTSINRGMSILEGLWPVSRETSVHAIDSPQSGSGRFYFGSIGRSDPDDVSGERNLTTHGG
jgi:antitoxin HicB